MKEKITSIVLLIIVGCLIEFGLASFFMDLAYRGNNPEIQAIVFILAIFFPIFILLGFYKQFTKFVTLVSVIISLLYMIYFTKVYGVKMITGNHMFIITLGFIVTIMLIGKIILIKKKS